MDSNEMQARAADAARAGWTSGTWKGPRGGFVTDRGYEHVTCPTCGNVAVWPPNLRPDVPCAPPGHYLIRDDDGHVVDDICPEA